MTKYLFPFACFIALLCSCEKNDPEIPHEEELITTLIYTLSPTNGGANVEFIFRDIDGDGGDVPIVEEGLLASNTTYEGVLTLFNEAEIPSEELTAEIETEGTDHQFFFQHQLSNIQINYSDQDTDGNPIGLSTTLTTGNPEVGTLDIILKHEPNKDASGVPLGDISNAGGETDIQVTFNIDVQ